jgi:DNA-directed RNA polymerase subunit RPC12/RpoP
MTENKINISLDKTDEIKCECGNNTFLEGMMLRKVSRFVIGSSQNAIIPISVMVCSKCGEILEETIPSQLKQQTEEE